MKILDKAKALADDFTGTNEINRLTQENRELRESERAAINYVRRKINQLLMVMGTLPIKPEELDDHTLLELDPIGIIAGSFGQVLEHLSETNEKLKVASDEIQAILTAAGVPILVVDKEMRIQAYNPKLREIFPHISTEIIGETCCKMLCNLEVPPQECTFTKITAARRSVQLSNWVFNDRIFDVVGTPIKNRYGDITHVVMVYNDITDRRRTEQALRESEEMYRTLFEQANDLIQSVDCDGRFRYVNPVWRQTLGYGTEEIHGLTLLDVLHPDHRDHCMTYLAHLKAGNNAERINTVFLAKDGREIRVEGNVSCCFVEGKPSYTCGVFRVVADQRS